MGVPGLPDAFTLKAVPGRVTGAQKNWAALDARACVGILFRVANEIEQGVMREVARLMTLETGKPYPGSIGKIANTPPFFRYYAELARQDLGRIAGPMQPGSFQYVIHGPAAVRMKPAVIDPVARMADWWPSYASDWSYCPDRGAGGKHARSIRPARSRAGPLNPYRGYAAKPGRVQIWRSCSSEVTTRPSSVSRMA